MRWHQLRLYNDSNRYQARLALFNAFVHGIDCLVLADHEDNFIGVLDKERVLKWIFNDSQLPLASVANHKPLVLDAKECTLRIRRVMITRRISAVPTLYQGRLVGMFRV